MHPDLMRNYLVARPLSRRAALRLGAAAAATAATVACRRATIAAASPTAQRHRRPRPRFDDEIFDYADPANLSDWVPSRYGPGDQRGAFNEVTADKTARALSTLRGRGPRRDDLQPRRADGQRDPGLRHVTAADLRATVDAARLHASRRLRRRGRHRPVADTDRQQPGQRPRGTLRLCDRSRRSERCRRRTRSARSSTISTTSAPGSSSTTAFRGPDIAHGWGTSSLGGEHMGPVVTRGVLLDVLGQKLASGDDEALGPPAANGHPVLADTYRITIDDLEAAMEFGHIRSLSRGDAVMIRTGWNQLLSRTDREYDEDDLARWGAAGGMPGIYLAEARWLASFRPAVVGSDTWALEVLGSDDNDPTAAFPVHQELLMRHGIRIAESVVLDALADDGAHEYVHIVTPQFAEGATAGNTPPAGLAVRRHRRVMRPGHHYPAHTRILMTMTV